MLRNMILAVTVIAVALSTAIPAVFAEAKKRAAPEVPPEMGLPIMKKRTEIYYPREALERQISAQVVVQLLVGLDTVPTDISAIKCSTLPVKRAEEFCPVFAEAAMATVSEWRWKPGTVDGTPTPVYFTVRVDFDPSDTKIRKWPTRKSRKKRSN
jgi:outer membrane biosynthesis protein TonB